MTPVRRERKNPQLETRLLEYRQWTRTYGGYHSSSTVPQQVRTIRRFEELCNMLDPKSSSDVIPDEIVRESERGVKPQSLNHIEYDIEAWSRFLGTTVHLPRFRQSPMTESWIPMYDDVAAIRRASYSFPDRAIRSRNSCIIDLLFTGGMRIGELIRVNLEDLEGDLLHIRSEKNVRPRIIGLPQSLTERVNEYISTYRSPTDPFALFTTEIGHLNYGLARNLVKKIAVKTGVPRFHAHAARHWCATALLRRDSHRVGLDIREIQIYPEHASLASTQVYTNLTGREVAKHTSEKMGEFFRMKSIKAESANPHGTVPALYGGTEYCWIRITA